MLALGELLEATERRDQLDVALARVEVREALDALVASSESYGYATAALRDDIHCGCAVPADFVAFAILDLYGRETPFEAPASRQALVPPAPHGEPVSETLPVAARELSDEDAVLPEPESGERWLLPAEVEPFDGAALELQLLAGPASGVRHIHVSA
jgi:hypothetical protein